MSLTNVSKRFFQCRQIINGSAVLRLVRGSFAKCAFLKVTRIGTFLYFFFSNIFNTLNGMPFCLYFSKINNRVDVFQEDYFHHFLNFRL